MPGYRQGTRSDGGSRGGKGRPKTGFHQEPEGFRAPDDKWKRKGRPIKIKIGGGGFYVSRALRTR